MADAQTMQDEVTYYFSVAANDHTDMTLYFMWDHCQLSVVRAPCVLVKQGHFVVRVPLSHLQDAPIIWGADVNGFFTVRIHDTIAWHFKSKLVRIYNAPPDAMLLIFPLPDRLDHEQQRYSRRVTIGKGDAKDFGIWYADMEGGEMEKLPFQVWRPFKNVECELGELSPSGMRLDFLTSPPYLAQLSINDAILLKGDFGTPDKPLPLYILGGIVRKMPRLNAPDLMSLGCHFRSWRKIDAKGDKWFRAHPQEGITAINQWLARNYNSVAFKV